MFISGVISTKTFTELYVLAILTIVVEIPEERFTLLVLIKTIPPILVFPIPSRLSSKLYERHVTS